MTWHAREYYQKHMKKSIKKTIETNTYIVNIIM